MERLAKCNLVSLAKGVESLALPTIASCLVLMSVQRGQAQSLGAPSLTSPSNDTTNLTTSVTFAWGSVALATSYEIQVSTDNTFANTFADQSQTGTSYSVSGLLNNTTYYWRVRAFTLVLTGAWSSVWSFTTIIASPSVPTLLSPTNGATNQPTFILLSWNAAANSTKYWLQVATNQSFSNIFFGDSTIISTSEQVNNLSASRTYYWRVRGINSAGRGGWSSAWSFTTGSSSLPPPVPSLLSPSNGLTNQLTTMVFTWNSATNADHYFIQVSTDSVFSTSTFSNYTLIDTSWQVSGLSTNITYYWHVKGVDSGGQSDWSSTWHFTTGSGVTPPGTPVLSSPPNAALNQPDSVTLLWGHSVRATTYNLEVDSSGSFSNLIINDTGLVDTSLYVSGLAKGVTFSWRVQAVNSAGLSSWSSAWTFTTKAALVPPAVPALLSPQNGSINLALADTLSWSASSNASSYRLQVSTATSFNSTIVNDSGVTQTSVVVTGLADSMTYYWHVEAVNSAGESGWSTAWKFSTVVPAKPPATPNLLSPPDRASNLPNADTLRWAPSQYALSYQVEFSADSAFHSTMVDDSNITRTSEVVTGLADSTTYYWRVGALNSAGTSGWSNVRRFSTTPLAKIPSVPLLQSPLDRATNLPLTDTLRWGYSQYAQTYQLEFAIDSTFSSILESDSGITQTSVVEVGLVANSTYFWRVRASNSVGASGWSNAWRFTTMVPARVPDLPTLLSPKNGSTSLPYVDTLEWESSQYASSYDVEIATDSIFHSTILDVSGITKTSEAVTGLADSTEYFWRVEAVNSSGVSGWSSIWSFTTLAVTKIPNVPSLVSPPNQAIDQPDVDTLTWASSPYAQSYQVEFSIDSSFSSLLESDSGVAQTSVIETGLTENSSYFWRVRALNSAGASSWSAVWRFSTAIGSFPSPVLSTPPKGANDLPGTVACSWDGGSGSVLYHLQVAKDSSFNLLIVNDSAITDTPFTLKNLDSDMTYFWHVRAKSNKGIWSAFSSTWRFSTVSKPVQPSSVAVAITVNFPSTSSSTPLDATDYRLVGFPGAGRIPVSSIFQGAQGKAWDAYWDNGAASNYLIRLAPSSNDTTFIFSLGRAFWILKAGSLKVDTTVAAAALDSINAADVPLHTGWNLITDPFSDSVSWSAVESMNAISQPLYEFRGAFQVASSLVAGNGYYFFNQGNMSVLRVPFQSEARAKLIAANRVDEFDSSAWSVKVILDAGGIIDNSTWFGVSRFATDGFNPLDVRKPAGMRFVPGSYFSRPDWDKSYSIFGSDVRAEFSDLSEWNIDVNSRPSQSARLQFSGLENVPSVFDVYALDPISQTWINLRRSPSFNFVPLSETTSFDIVVGNAESVRKKIVDSDAKTFSLGQNYPNPFNPSTVIPVYDRISSHLKITVFDILGQEVATIFDGDVQPGQHLFNWDATDRDGRAVASGVYIYRAAFEPGESMVRKMVLLR